MIHKTFQSFRNALNGLITTWNEEHNFRTETFISIIVLGITIYFKFTFIEIMFCVISIILVLTAEIINTAIEDLSDMVEPNQNRFIGKIKDTMAGYVLVSSLGACVIGVLVFYHHFLFNVG